jgi:hypothetical protein
LNDELRATYLKVTCLRFCSFDKRINWLQGETADEAVGDAVDDAVDAAPDANNLFASS